jgi:hypothetical protein
MIQIPQQELLQRNAERVMQLMQRSIEKFNQTNNPKLAQQWSMILLNYKRAFMLKTQKKPQ